MRNLDRLLHPRSIAVVGAANDPRKVRGMVIARLRAAGFSGSIHPVNPGYETIQGLPASPSVLAVAGEVDLAVIVVASPQLVAAVEDCATKGVHAAVILSGLPGGEEGAVIQEQVAAIAARSGMIVVGPNTLGFWNPAHGVAATFAPPVEAAGNTEPPAERAISVVSHSGGIGLSMYDKCHRAGLGIRYVLTTGNEADLEMVEAIDHFVEEGGSRIVLAYMEGLKRPADFARVAAKAADRGVQIIVLKAGTSAAGERAAVSHTAHMTGSNSAYDAMFERYGVLRVDDIEQMMAVTRLLSGKRAMAGNGVLVLSTGGGYGALFADACDARGLAVPDLDPVMQGRLAATIPAYGTPANPVDLPGAFVLEDGGVSLGRIIDDFGEAANLDAVILCFNLDGPGRIAAMLPAIGPSLERLRKPALFYSPTLVAPDNQRALAALGVHQYSLPECAFALQALARISRFRKTWAAESGARPAPDPLPAAAAPVTRWTADEAVAILSDAGIDLPPQAVAGSADEAARQAAVIGFPVALKIQSPDIAHKSDCGGVILSLGDADAVRAAYAPMLEAVRARAPHAAIEGALVQRMAGKGREFAIGMIRDPDFGPLLMLAAGGILVEVLEDAVFAPLPLAPGDPARMIDKLRSARLLEPLRGEPAADRAALEALLMAVSRLVETRGEAIAELEFNPVLVHPQGHGVSVVDYLVVHPESR